MSPEAERWRDLRERIARMRMKPLGALPASQIVPVATVPSNQGPHLAGLFVSASSPL